MNVRRITTGAAVLATAGLLGGCAVYPAYPAYTSYPSAPVVYGGNGVPVAPATTVAPAPVVVQPSPVYVAPPPPVYYGPAFYPSIRLGIFGRFGGHGHGHRHHRHRH